MSTPTTLKAKTCAFSFFSFQNLPKTPKGNHNKGREHETKVLYKALAGSYFLLQQAGFAPVFNKIKRLYLGKVATPLITYAVLAGPANLNSN